MTELNQILSQYGETQYKSMVQSAVYNENCIIINEIFFSKKDLQDPKTLDKLLNRAKVEKDIKSRLDLMLFIGTFFESFFGARAINKFIKKHLGDSLGIITHILSWISIMGLTFKAVSTGNDFLAYIHENRIKKLKRQAEKLRDKFKESDDPKAKEIVKNCQQVIDAIDKYYKAEEKKVYDAKLKEYKEIYHMLQSMINGGDSFDPSELAEWFAMAKVLNIPFEKIEKGAIKNIGEHDSLCMAYLGENYKDLDQRKKDVYAKLAEAVPEFRTDSLKYKLYYAIDDTVLYYAPSIHKFIYGGWQPDDADVLYSKLFEIVEKNEWLKEQYEENLKKYEKEKEIILIAVDKSKKK